MIIHSSGWAEPHAPLTSSFSLPSIPQKQPCRVQADVQAPCYEEAMGKDRRTAVHIAIGVPDTHRGPQQITWTLLYPKQLPVYYYETLDL